MFCLFVISISINNSRDGGSVNGDGSDACHCIITWTSSDMVLEEEEEEEEEEKQQQQQHGRR